MQYFGDVNNTGFLWGSDFQQWYFQLVFLGFKIITITLQLLLPSGLYRSENSSTWSSETRWTINKMRFIFLIYGVILWESDGVRQVVNLTNSLPTSPQLKYLRVAVYYLNILNIWWNIWYCLPTSPNTSGLAWFALFLSLANFNQFWFMLRCSIFVTIYWIFVNWCS